MNNVDAGDTTLPTDIYDAGDTASPPVDVLISMHPRPAQPVNGAAIPTFTAVDFGEAISPEPGLVLYVKVGGTTTTVTVQVPGVQPYTGIARDDLDQTGLQNTERVFYIPEFLTDPAADAVVVAYSQSTAVTSALLKVD